MRFHPGQRVHLLQDIPSEGLFTGDAGLVTDVQFSPLQYEVEFSDYDSETDEDSDRIVTFGHDVQRFISLCPTEEPDLCAMQFARVQARIQPFAKRVAWHAERSAGLIMHVGWRNELTASGSDVSCTCADAVVNCTPHGIFCRHACWLLMEKGGCHQVDLHDEQARAAAIQRARQLIADELTIAIAPYRVEASSPARSEECPICYDELGATPCCKCPSCWKPFHARCMHACLRARPNCPWCRAYSWDDWMHVLAR